MNTSQDQSVQNSGQTNPPKTIHDLHQAFAEIAFSYGMTGRDLTFSSLLLLERDCRRLFCLARSMRKAMDQASSIGGGK